MHGLSPDEEIDYWRKRAETAEKLVAVDRSEIQRLDLALAKERQEVERLRASESANLDRWREAQKVVEEVVRLRSALTKACDRWLDLIPLADISDKQRIAECASIDELRKDAVRKTEGA